MHGKYVPLRPSVQFFQICGVHDLFLNGDPSQCLPPFADGTSIFLLAYFAPQKQLTPHGDQLDHSQLTRIGQK